MGWYRDANSAKYSWNRVSSVSSGWKQVPRILSCFTPTIGNLCLSSSFAMTFTLLWAEFIAGALMKIPSIVSVVPLSVLSNCTFPLNEEQCEPYTLRSASTSKQGKHLSSDAFWSFPSTFFARRSNPQQVPQTGIFSSKINLYSPSYKALSLARTVLWVVLSPPGKTNPLYLRADRSPRFFIL